MYNPIATYRLQFNQDFPFAEAQRLADYFDLLGVATVYASPINTAVPGSVHGYDVTDPDTVNPELGGKEALRRLIASLAHRRIGWMQDIVPNHMAFNHRNRWLKDVLEKGHLSAYSGIFDIEWEHPLLAGKIMVPMLGETLDRAVADGKLQLAWQEGTFHLVYFEHCWPLRFESVRNILHQNDPPPPPLLKTFLEQHHLADREPDGAYLNGEWEQCKQDLATMSEEQAEVDTFLRQQASLAGRDAGLLLDLTSEQHYRLAHWQETEKTIGYRRFFTINDLICLRMEDEHVFQRWHHWLPQWLSGNGFTALRVDHVDGLRAPGQYLRHLRKLAGDTPCILVEKILATDEALPAEWPVQGTTGYDFLAQVNHLLTYSPALRELEAFYAAITGTDQPLKEQEYRARRFILSHRMQGEWDNLVTLFYRLSILPPDTDPPPRDAIRSAIGEFLLAMPVYRFYLSDPLLKPTERDRLLQVVALARPRDPIANEGLTLLATLIRHAACNADRRAEEIQQFFTRMMQMASPLMAKGVEDTLMYRYCYFAAWNEVGDRPASIGMDTARFHAAMQARQAQWPLTMNATSSHDSKRGEDMRARLNVISEMPGQWAEQVQHWMRLNHPLKQTCEDEEAPSVAEEYLLYQTLVGMLPFSQEIDELFIDRLEQYMVKALSEAKIHSAWNAPHKAWEDATKTFIRRILQPQHDFLSVFLPFQQQIAHFGIYNSLSQLALKTTCPGVPDIYRGTELWDLNLVDPDNRRPLDFSDREKMLKTLIKRHIDEPDKFIPWLLSDVSSGRMKLWLTHRLLCHRRAHPELFTRGSYRPLSVTGTQKEHILAFARRDQGAWHLSIVPMHVSLLATRTQTLSFCKADWQDTRVLLPDESPEHWTDVVTGQMKTFDKYIAVADLLEAFPVGLLYGEQGKIRHTQPS